MNDKEKLERAITLLKATKELLEKQYYNICTINLLEETVFYDGADCSGDCLHEDIENLLMGCQEAENG